MYNRSKRPFAINPPQSFRHKLVNCPSCGSYSCCGCVESDKNCSLDHSKEGEYIYILDPVPIRYDNGEPIYRYFADEETDSDSGIPMFKEYNINSKYYRWEYRAKGGSDRRHYIVNIGSGRCLVLNSSFISAGVKTIKDGCSGGKASWELQRLTDMGTDKKYMFKNYAGITTYCMYIQSDGTLRTVLCNPQDRYQLFIVIESKN
jgi:hypothetical protein